MSHFPPSPLPDSSRRAAFTSVSTGMDVARAPEHTQKRRRRRWLIAAGAVGALGLLTLGLARLGPAVPTVARDTVWTGAVRRGELIRQVRGLGTLVPEEIRWIPAVTDAHVERIVVFPGATVTADTLILVLSNPELKQSALDADAAVTAAQARLVNLRAQLQGQSLERQAAFAKAQGDRDTAAAQVEVDEKLSRQGLIAPIELKKSEISAKELAACCEIEGQRVEFTKRSVDPQIAVAQGDLDQARAQAALKHSQLDALQVRAGMAGVLQLMPVEAGQRVTAGTNLARVADPARLKAQIKIPETQARDVTVGQSVSVDTRNGVIMGHVARLDPAVQAGTVLADVTFNGAPLPRGARPDLSVEGTVELDRIPDTLIVNRPAFGREDSVIGLFRLSADGAEATRVKVQLGRGSVGEIEVRDGLRAGDQIILSDTSTYDNSERIRLK